MTEEVKVHWHTELATEKMRTAGLIALEHAGRYLLDKANETVPRATGGLADSGHVDVDAEAMTVSVGYDEPYASIQHEDTEYHHQGSGRAKWLQLTAQEQQAEVGRILEEETRL